MLTDAARPTTFAVRAVDEHGEWRDVPVAGEHPLTLYIDKQELITLIESGRLEAGKMRTATFVFDSALFFQPTQAQPYGFVDATVVPVLNQLKALEAQGKIAFTQFRNTTPTWQTQFASVASNWPPQDCVSFHWNTQDFARPATSAAYLHRLLDLHEQLQVPVDVFLTETMIDQYEQLAPSLVGRLKSSAMVSMSYHVRPPKPLRLYGAHAQSRRRYQGCDV